jgi:hypothetical protein
MCSTDLPNLINEEDERQVLEMLEIAEAELTPSVYRRLITMYERQKQLNAKLQERVIALETQLSWFRNGN